MRNDGRKANQLRPLLITPSYIKTADGSVLIEMGDTKVICTAKLEERVPPFLRNSGKGWITAEYGMLPRARASAHRARSLARQHRRAHARDSEIHRPQLARARGAKKIWGSAPSRSIATYSKPTAARARRRSRARTWHSWKPRAVGSNGASSMSILSEIPSPPSA